MEKIINMYTKINYCPHYYLNYKHLNLLDFGQYYQVKVFTDF